MYRLERQPNGEVRQCETNADGGSIYARREEISKQALKNLERPTAGKLGKLANLQVFNFNISGFTLGTSVEFFRAEWNTTGSFPANATQTIMFGVESLNNKALYYNIMDIRVDLNTSDLADSINLLSDSYMQFYLLQNIETSTTSLGTKIPQPSPLYGNSGGAVTFTTTGAIQGHQYTSHDFISDSTAIPVNSKGLRASGLALKALYLQFADAEDASQMSIDVQVFVDVTSVSTTY